VSAPSTIPELFLDRVQKTPQQIAYQTPEGKAWRDWTWQQIGDRVRDIAMGLRALGLQDEQRCSIASGTRCRSFNALARLLCTFTRPGRTRSAASKCGTALAGSLSSRRRLPRLLCAIHASGFRASVVR